jgi:hypothetical protein
VFRYSKQIEIPQRRLSLVLTAGDRFLAEVALCLSVITSRLTLNPTQLPGTHISGTKQLKSESDRLVPSTAEVSFKFIVIALFKSFYF